ncbi:MAG: hypothetical protein RR334_02340 [Clostridia bacterium]
MLNKKLFSNLKYYLIASAVLLITGIIVILSAGMNLSIQLGGGYQIDIKLNNTLTAENAINGASDVLNKNHLIVEESFTQDKKIDNYASIRTNAKDFNDTIKNEIADKLGIDKSAVTVSKIGATESTSYIMYAVLGIIITAVFAFLLGLIRYSALTGISLAFITIHTTLISTSIMIFTRVLFTTSSIISITALSLVALIISIVILENNKSQLNVITLEKGKTFSDSLILSVNKNIKMTIIISSCILLFAFIMLFAGNIASIMFSLAIIISLISALYSSLVVGMSIEAKLHEGRAYRQKKKLSKNKSN